MKKVNQLARPSQLLLMQITWFCLCTVRSKNVLLNGKYAKLKCSNFSILKTRDIKMQ